MMKTTRRNFIRTGMAVIGASLIPAGNFDLQKEKGKKDKQ